MNFTRSTVAALLIFGATAASAAAPVVLGPDDFENGAALLSDSNQSFGQVVGTELSITGSRAALTSLTVWGLYYNYADFDEAAPQTDDFTLRFHDVSAGDPDEAIAAEFSLGAGTRVSTGEELNDGAIGLELFQYSFDLAGLGIQLGGGDYLMSIINDVGSLAQAQSDGYWHWLNGSVETGGTWFRRENAADFNPNDPGFQSTINWTSVGSTGQRAFALEAEIPAPAPLALLGLGLLALGAARRRRTA